MATPSTFDFRTLHKVLRVEADLAITNTLPQTNQRPPHTPGYNPYTSLHTSYRVLPAPIQMLPFAAREVAEMKRSSHLLLSLGGLGLVLATTEGLLTEPWSTFRLTPWRDSEKMLWLRDD